MQAIGPDILVCLGATAAQALFGSSFRVGAHRGEVVDSKLGPTLITVHPSSILRSPDEESRRTALAAFVDDLRKLRPYVKHEDTKNTKAHKGSSE